MVETSSNDSFNDEETLPKMYETRTKKKKTAMNTLVNLGSITREDSGEEQQSESENGSNEEFLVCRVCNSECGGAHKCKVCKQAVHAICGEIQDEEEGFGSSVVCNRCKKTMCLNKFNKIKHIETSQKDVEAVVTKVPESF